MNLAYYWYEAAHWMLAPARAASDATKLIFESPINPLTHTAYGRTVAAACELFERTTRRYEKPAFGLATALVARRARPRPPSECVVGRRPFGPRDLLRRGLHKPRGKPSRSS